MNALALTLAFMVSTQPLGATSWGLGFGYINGSFLLDEGEEADSVHTTVVSSALELVIHHRPYRSLSLDVLIVRLGGGWGRYYHRSEGLSGEHQGTFVEGEGDLILPLPYLLPLGEPYAEAGKSYQIAPFVGAGFNITSLSELESRRWMYSLWAGLRFSVKGNGGVAIEIGAAWLAPPHEWVDDSALKRHRLYILISLSP